MLNFFLCFWSELATDEVVLLGTIRLDSKIRSQNVHLHDSFWREQTLAGTKLTRIDFAVAVSSRAVRISSRAVRVFPALSLRRVRPSYGTFSLMFFQGNCAWGRTGHMINGFYVLVARTISHSFAGPTREILFLPLEHKIHIFSPPSNILYYRHPKLRM